jgi:hypothetical protein
MGENQEVEVQEEQKEQEAEGQKEGKPQGPKGASVSKAINSFMGSLEAALAGRGNAVMVRVNDDALAKLDMLVEAGICKSRSESAAFLLQRGIDSSGTLYDRIVSVTTQITRMREDLLSTVVDAEE